MVICYLLAPFFAFCNAYGMGLTDWSLLTTYGKVAIFIFAGWGGQEGGIIAGLATGTALATIVGAAADLMQVLSACWPVLCGALSALVLLALRYSVGMKVGCSSAWGVHPLWSVALLSKGAIMLLRAGVFGQEADYGKKHCTYIASL